MDLKKRLLKSQSNFTDMQFYDSGVSVAELKKTLAHDMMHAVSVTLVEEFNKEIRAQYDTEYDRRRAKTMLAGEEPSPPNYSMYPRGINAMRLELFMFTHTDMVKLLIDIASMDKEELQHLIIGVFQDSKQYNLNFDRIFLTNEIIE